MVTTKIFFLFHTTVFLSCVILLLPGDLSPKLSEKKKTTNVISLASPPRDILWGALEFIFFHFALFHWSTLDFLFKKSQLSVYYSTRNKTPAYCNSGYELFIHHIVKLCSLLQPSTQKAMGSFLLKCHFHYCLRKALGMSGEMFSQIWSLALLTCNQSLGASSRSRCKCHHRYHLKKACPSWMPEIRFQGQSDTLVGGTFHPAGSFCSGKHLGEDTDRHLWGLLVGSIRTTLPRRSPINSFYSPPLLSSTIPSYLNSLSSSYLTTTAYQHCSSPNPWNVNMVRRETRIIILSFAPDCGT